MRLAITSMTTISSAEGNVREDEVSSVLITCFNRSRQRPRDGKRESISLTLFKILRALSLSLNLTISRPLGDGVCNGLWLIWGFTRDPRLAGFLWRFEVVVWWRRWEREGWVWVGLVFDAGRWKV
ncbi:hypothetical protein Ddye_011909 [Dipteronia dyeriana]|uniref:Uncharacterized protein n=1 Tax=Dipteronia dyeriana TaxID=168575 RepID=A0AAD9X3B5_9ROSI|nr:hypothetical protein Ddye_011909 [Dipteronia dyeriana]